MAARYLSATLMILIAIESYAHAALTLTGTNGETDFLISSGGANWNLNPFPPSGNANVYWDANRNGIFGEAGENDGNDVATLAFNAPITSGEELHFGVEGFGSAAETGTINFILELTDSSPLSLSVTEGMTEVFFDSNGDPWEANFEFNDGFYGDVVFNGGAGGNGANVNDHQGILTLTQGISSLIVEVDRDNGNVTLVNDSPSTFNIAGLSMTSELGALDPSSWLSVTDNYDEGNGGTQNVSADEWVIFESNPDDLSEGTLGSGSITSGQSIDLGNGLWLKNPSEDVVFEYLDANTGEIIDVQVAFTGTTQTVPYELGDLNFDGDINELDWPIYRDGFDEDLSGMSVAQAYQSGDLNGDLLNDAIDFGLFRNAFEANNPGVSFASLVAGSSVPEPATLSLSAIGILILMVRRAKQLGLCKLKRLHSMKFRTSSLVCCFSLLALVATSLHVNAQPVLIYDAAGQTLPAVTDSSGNGNDGTAGGAGVTIVADGPVAGSSSFAFDAGDDRITTNAIDLLDNAAVVAAGGFTMDTWIRTDGVGLGNSASVIDYAGTERIQFDSGGTDAITFQISDGGAVVVSSVDVTDDAWHRVTAEFIVSDGSDLAAVAGDLRLTVDGITEPLVPGTLSDFGDSLDRPIGIGGHPLGFAGDVYTGLIHNPSVSLGLVPEPGLLELEVNTVNGTASIVNNSGDSLDINLYQIKSPDGSLDASGWTGFDGDTTPNLANPGDSWEELGTPDANFLGEAFLQGDSTVADASSVSLGSLFNTSVGTEDLEFLYRRASGSIVEGTVSYITTPGGNGDYNGDGVVDAADYVLWRNNLGAPDESAINNQGDGGGITASDYNYWKARFGDTTGSLKASSGAVPEPGSVALVLAACGMGLVALRRNKGVSQMSQKATVKRSHIVAAMTLTIVAWAVVGSSALATVTNDRVFLFGDANSADDTSGANVVEGGAMGFDFSGVTITADEIGPSGGGFADLQVFGATYTSTTAQTGVADDFGANFNGINNYLFGDNTQTGRGGLGFPGDVTPQNPVVNYTNIFSRGIQTWVRPTNGGSNVQAGHHQRYLSVRASYHRHGYLGYDMGF